MLNGAKAKGLQCGSQALLEMFLGGQPVDPVHTGHVGPSLENITRWVSHLRGPEGCERCREETPEHLQESLLRTAHDTVRAINGEDSPKLRDGLGELLRHVVVLARVAQADGQFDLQTVLTELDEKLTSQHRHVLGKGHD